MAEKFGLPDTVCPYGGNSGLLWSRTHSSSIMRMDDVLG